MCEGNACGLIPAPPTFFHLPMEVWDKKGKKRLCCSKHFFDMEQNMSFWKHESEWPGMFLPGKINKNQQTQQKHCVFQCKHWNLWTSSIDQVYTVLWYKYSLLLLLTPKKRSQFCHVSWNSRLWFPHSAGHPIASWKWNSCAEPAPSSAGLTECGHRLSSSEGSCHCGHIPVHFVPEHPALVQTSSNFKHKQLVSIAMKWPPIACASLQRFTWSLPMRSSVTTKNLCQNFWCDKNGNCRPKWHFYTLFLSLYCRKNVEKNTFCHLKCKILQFWSKKFNFLWFLFSATSKILRHF